MKTCNSIYAYQLIKGCRFMRVLKTRDENGQRQTRCSCTKNCAMCSVGGNVTTTLKIKSETASKWGEKIGGGADFRKIKKAAPRIDREVHSQQVPIWMHPELHDEYVQNQAVSIGSNTHNTSKTLKGRVKKAKTQILG